MREFELIRKIRQANASLGAQVLIPPGDDLGMVELPGGVPVLAGVDQVIGGVHLPLDAEPERYGRKLVNRSLSDVAAMGAVPVGLIVSAALPTGFEEQWGGRLSDAVRAAGAACECPVFGGDVATLASDADHPVLTATVLAVPDSQAGSRVVLRSGARPTDEIWVSGTFGRSLRADGGGHHEEFEPRITLALSIHRALGESLTCMIDVSDGLAADAGHLARESGVRFELEAGSVPRRDGASTHEALGDGEDYELCFCVRAGTPVPTDPCGIPLTRIGSVHEGEGLIVREDGRSLDLDSAGWEHGT